MIHGQLIKRIFLSAVELTLGAKLSKQSFLMLVVSVPAAPYVFLFGSFKFTRPVVFVVSSLTVRIHALFSLI